jgi:hypothetical protein
MNYLMRLNFVFLAIFSSILIFSESKAARFNGGICNSQGNWLQAALQQADVISEAINSLQNDPNCKSLIEALRSAPKYEKRENDDSETSSYANLGQELQALSQYINPKPGTINQISEKTFRDIVFQTVFNKTFQSIRDIQVSPDIKSMTSANVAQIQNVSLRLKAFLRKSKDVAEMTMSQASGILAALPNSELCLHNKPSVAATLFGAFAHSAASLTTGGEMNGIGKFVGDLLDYQRNMKYIKALKPIEVERFYNSVSCLIESTSEAYCSVQDAESTLNLFKEYDISTVQKNRIDEVVQNKDKDVVASPLAGLILMMRDIPTIQAWMQKILFGINPQISAEATMKNEYWGSYLMFIQSIYSLMADFNDKEQLYYATTRGQKTETKLSQIKEILDTTLGNISGGPKAGINFFLKAEQPENIPFYLINVQRPSDFNVQTKNFDTFWLQWTQELTNGLQNPDQLLKTMRNQLWDLMDRAQLQANEFFANRMIVDPQNLISEAMKGPGTSPFQAFHHLKSYYESLIEKLQTGAKIIEKSPLQIPRAKSQLAQIALIKDTLKRIDKIIQVLEQVGKIDSKSDVSPQTQSQMIMSAIYETANMMVSRDSLFGTRMGTLLQADISDTLYRNSSLNEKQRDYFLAVGPKIVSQLSGYFAINPVNQRADLSAAKLIHIKNLESTEDLFANNIFSRISEIVCDIEGGYACEIKSANINLNDRSLMTNTINPFLANSRKNRGLFFKFLNWYHKPKEDSMAHEQVRAKLCMQALAFKSRDSFAEVCRGAVLLSDFANPEDTFGLNMSFDTNLSKINSLLLEKKKGHIDSARSEAVCSLRSYLRKNHIFFMYKEFMDAK